jgi:hypothetical protein
MERSQLGAATLDGVEIDTIITAGIRTFLHGHLPRPTTRQQRQKRTPTRRRPDGT